MLRKWREQIDFYPTSDSKDFFEIHYDLIYLPDNYYLHGRYYQEHTGNYYMICYHFKGREFGLKKTITKDKQENTYT